MKKHINEYPQLIQTLVKELKDNYSVGEFYSTRFYEADNEKIAETLLKAYNISNKCSCWKCQGIEDPYKD